MDLSLSKLRFIVPVCRRSLFSFGPVWLGRWRRCSPVRPVVLLAYSSSRLLGCRALAFEVIVYRDLQRQIIRQQSVTVAIYPKKVIADSEDRCEADPIVFVLLTLPLRLT